MSGDGGPAFPTDLYYDEKRIGQSDGMTLRDYFAAKAMQGMLAEDCDYVWTSLAAAAYECADAMLKERVK
jgi:hypothetical protein